MGIAARLIPGHQRRVMQPESLLHQTSLPVFRQSERHFARREQIVVLRRIGKETAVVEEPRDAALVTHHDPQPSIAQWQRLIGFGGGRQIDHVVAPAGNSVAHVGARLSGQGKPGCQTQQIDSQYSLNRFHSLICDQRHPSLG